MEDAEILKEMQESHRQQLEEARDNNSKVLAELQKSNSNQLKEMRRQFARANHIEYYEEDCTETKPCAGTCPYCEERTKYLVNEAKKIAAVRDVIYPQFSDVKIQKEQVDPPYEDRPFLGGVGREYEPDLDGAV